MTTKCQLCRRVIDASPELVAQSQAREVILLCPDCKNSLAQNERDIEEYEREYTERLKQQWAMHHPGVTLCGS